MIFIGYSNKDRYDIVESMVFHLKNYGMTKEEFNRKVEKVRAQKEEEQNQEEHYEQKRREEEQL